jgi:uncharacterized membrane protein YgdD (TMEM256/DUF423 family)
MIIAALAGGLAVALGAFGAHAIKDILSPSRFDVYQTGARYLLVHAGVMFIAAWIARDGSSRVLIGSCFAFMIGMIAFSGSLVALGLTGLRVLGAVAPVGGVGFIAGWLLLGLGAWRATASVKMPH